MSDTPYPNAAGGASASKSRILFVDDEDMVLRMLRLAMSTQSDSWEPSFAASGAEALKLLSEGSYDMVVSDMRMPGMTGAQLLNEIFRLYPSTFRVILTGFVEQERVMESVGTAHQILSKPFQLDVLKELLSRAASLKQRLQSRRARLIIAQTGCVPSVPDVYFKILDALQEPDCPVERIADIAANDPGLTSKLLQLVNSAFFGFGSTVSAPREAVMLLGTGTIRSLALTCGLFSAFSPEISRELDLQEIWAHSWRVARAAERIARSERSDTVVIEQAFTAGLLHDLGKLIFANALHSEYVSAVQSAAAESRPLSELENEKFEATHAEVGACLLQLWGLPTPLVEAVLHHEQPDGERCEGFSPLLAVHVANALDHESRPSKPPQPVPLNVTFLEQSGLAPRLNAWRQHLSAEDA